MIADFLDFWDAWNLVTLDPRNREKVEAVRALVTGEMLSGVDARVEFFVENNYRMVTNQQLPPSIEVVDGSVSFEAGSTAHLTACGLDSNVMVETGGLPDGGDAVVNEAIVAVLAEFELQIADGRWVVASTTVRGAFPGSTTCGE